MAVTLSVDVSTVIVDGRIGASDKSVCEKTGLLTRSKKVTKRVIYFCKLFYSMWVREQMFARDNCPRYRAISRP